MSLQRGTRRSKAILLLASFSVAGLLACSALGTLSSRSQPSYPPIPGSQVAPPIPSTPEAEVPTRSSPESLGPTVAGQSTASPAVTPSTLPETPDLAARVSDSLSLLLGGEPSSAVGSADQGRSSAFPSFHLKASYSDPYKWWGGVGIGWLVLYDKVEADVQGHDLHLIQTSRTWSLTFNRLWWQPPDANFYVVNGKEMMVVQGAPVDVPGSVLALWGNWPWSLALAVQAGAFGSSPNGDDSVAGRQAQVVDIDTARAQAGQLESLPGYPGIAVVYSRGRVWIDRVTGALLKAQIEYKISQPEQDEYLPPIPVVAKLEVSEIGRAVVTLP